MALPPHFLRDTIFVTISVLVGATFGGVAYSMVVALLPETPYRSAIAEALAAAGAFSGLVWGLVNRHKLEDKT